VAEDKKIKAYVCTGCDIGKCLDIEALKKVAAEEYGLGECAEHPWLCGAEGVELIKKDIADGANAVVIAACSPRAMTGTFTFNGTQVERVNLREHVIWSHEPNDEDTQMMAEDYMRMGITRAQKAGLPEPHIEETSKDIVVVGGGVTGLNTAIEAAKAGYQVTILEKADHLGGRVADSCKSFPKRPPYGDLVPTGIEDTIAAVESDDKIKVYLKAEIESVDGQPGQFDFKIKSGGEAVEFRAGAIVQATGWKPYDANKLDYLAYGKSPNVVTNVQVEEMMKNGGLKRPSDGAAPNTVAFIQCAGSRDKDHLPYCSSVCCRVSMKQALYVREQNPDADVYILYKDIRSPGQYEDFYRHVQEDPGVFFTKGEVKGIEPVAGDRLKIDVEDTLIDPKVQVEADMVVLATGMVPNAADGEKIRQLVDAHGIIAKGEAGAQLEMAKKTAEELADYEGTQILNLNYRQGPDFPVLKYNFPDSHFICFPYETRRTGIYAAGCLRAPNDSDSCVEDGTGAAMKAIQAVELTSQGVAVHPRWEDRSFPDFFMQRCTKCKRCTEECPFGTINEDADGTPKPNPFRCRRCGICLGSCPERIISFKDYSIDIVSSMIKAVEIPDEEDEKPRLLGLLCENDAYPALDTAGILRKKYTPNIRFIPVRCMGAINVVWIADALSRGYDGVLLVGCKSGDDYQCHFTRGSELMKTRGDNIQEKLTQLALETERVRLEELAITEFHKLPEIIEEFAEEIDEAGLNPFKGF
jgi:quinone-modifying oxidoreductase subunit QmoB